MIALMDETFGERLRRLRTERGFAPGELAYKVGITEGAIRQMESGQTKSASFPVGVRLASVLGVDAAYLALGERTFSLLQDARPEAIAGRLESLEAQVVNLAAQVQLLAGAGAGAAEGAVQKPAATRPRPGGKQSRKR